MRSAVGGDVRQPEPADAHPRGRRGVARVSTALARPELPLPGWRRSGVGLRGGLRQLAGHLRAGRGARRVPLRTRRHGSGWSVLRTARRQLGQPQRRHVHQHAARQRGRQLHLLVDVQLPARQGGTRSDPYLARRQPRLPDAVRVRDDLRGQRQLRALLLGGVQPAQVLRARLDGCFVADIPGPGALGRRRGRERPGGRRAPGARAAARVGPRVERPLLVVVV